MFFIFPEIIFTFSIVLFIFFIYGAWLSLLEINSYFF